MLKERGVLYFPNCQVVSSCTNCFNDISCLLLWICRFFALLCFTGEKMKCHTYIWVFKGLNIFTLCNFTLLKEKIKFNLMHLFVSWACFESTDFFAPLCFYREKMKCHIYIWVFNGGWMIFTVCDFTLLKEKIRFNLMHLFVSWASHLKILLPWDDKLQICRNIPLIELKGTRFLW